MIKYQRAKDIEAMIHDIVETLKLSHIIPYRIIAIRSYNAKTKAIARIWAFPKIWQTALEIKPFYVIEVIHERFDKLSNKEKIKTLIHELLHIPKNFGGGLLSHRQNSIDERREEKLLRIYIKNKKSNWHNTSL